MIRIAANQINKYYGAHQVLNGLTVEFFEGEKVGILGPNGAGKSTLMRILVQDEPFESGSLFITKGARIGALSQIPIFADDLSVKECLYSAFKSLLSIKSELDEIEKRLSVHENEALTKRYGALMHAFEHGDGYTIETRVNDIALGFNFNPEMLSKPFKNLSGGEKTRVGIATMLLNPLDVIFLDEPTNHLDLNTIEWLEGYIKKFKGTVIVISHDRYFLNQIVSRIVEVARGQAISFKGNYDDYAREKAITIKQQQDDYLQEQKTIKQLEEAAKRMHDWAERADSTAMHRRAFSIEKRIERMDKTERVIIEKPLSSAFESDYSVSKEVLNTIALSKSYGDKKIIDNQTLTIYKNQRIALLGDNGVGKTTILKMLLGLEPLDSGQIKWSPSAVIGYLPQEIKFETPEVSVLEYIKMELTLDENSARNLLARFKFKQEDVFKKLSGLSGGERTRLKLCELMNRKVNVLLLDEPTNHLDIPSREWVEEAITLFKGTMIFVSHDRHFIEKFSSHFWHLQDQMITPFEGSYSEYRESILPSIKPVKAHERETENVKYVKSDSTKKNSVKITLIEKEIYEIESELELLEQRINSSSTPYEVLQDLLVDKDEYLKKIEILYEQLEKYSD